MAELSLELLESDLDRAERRRSLSTEESSELVDVALSVLGVSIPNFFFA